MTTYESVGDSLNNIQFSNADERLTIIKPDGYGLYVQLSERDRKALALELLEDYFDVEFVPGGLALKEKRALPKIGEYYRVRSTSKMDPEFQRNPVVKVISKGNYSIRVETAEGEQTATSRARWQRFMEGPIEVQERTVWEQV